MHMRLVERRDVIQEERWTALALSLDRASAGIERALAGIDRNVTQGLIELEGLFHQLLLLLHQLAELVHLLAHGIVLLALLALLRTAGLQIVHHALKFGQHLLRLILGAGTGQILDLVHHALQILLAQHLALLLGILTHLAVLGGFDAAGMTTGLAVLGGGGAARSRLGGGSVFLAFGGEGGSEGKQGSNSESEQGSGFHVGVGLSLLLM